jgi:hypothetical protein
MLNASPVYSFGIVHQDSREFRNSWAYGAAYRDGHSKQTPSIENSGRRKGDPYTVLKDFCYFFAQSRERWWQAIARTGRDHGPTETSSGGGRMKESI